MAVEAFGKSSGQAEVAVIMTDVLGGCRRYNPEQPGDTHWRAKGVTEAIGAAAVTILLYDRAVASELHKRTFIMGICQAFEPDELVRRHAEQAREIQKALDETGARTSLALGASAAATDLLGVFKAGLEPTHAVLFDPVGLQPQTAGGLLLGWANHMVREASRPETARNHHGMPREATGKPPINAWTDMQLFRKEWTSGSAGETLGEIADGTIASSTTTLLVLPGKTFTRSAREAHALCEELNSRRAATAGKFTVLFGEALYHSATDDPEYCGRLAQFVLAAPTDRRPEDVLRYAPMPAALSPPSPAP